jgi:hypothetical protein
MCYHLVGVIIRGGGCKAGDTRRVRGRDIGDGVQKIMEYHFGSLRYILVSPVVDASLVRQTYFVGGITCNIIGI